MEKKSTYIIYLHPSVADNQWSFLHRFFHPGIRDNDKKYALVGYSLNTSHYALLSVTVCNFLKKGSNRRIHIPYNLVATMIEIPVHKNQLGFVDPEEFRDKLEPEKKT